MYTVRLLCIMFMGIFKIITKFYSRLPISKLAGSHGMIKNFYSNVDTEADLKNLSHGLNLSRGSNMVGFT